MDDLQMLAGLACLPALSDSDAEMTDAGECLGPEVAHIPRQNNKAKSGDKKYFLFKAASDGCVACVKRLVEKDGVNANIESLSCKYTALDFAEWFQTRGDNPSGCAEVISYLRHRSVSAQEVRMNLNVPVPGISADDI